MNMTTEVRNKLANNYVMHFERDGTSNYISNLETEVIIHRWGNVCLPTTINNGEKLDTFVCSPRASYIDYMRDEFSRFPDKRLVRPMQAIVNAAAPLLSAKNVNRIVHLNNWMISTNLPADIDSSLVEQETTDLVENYSEHILAMRSLTRRHSPVLMRALEVAGWVMIPSRQIFLVDDVVNETLKRTDSKNDSELWKQHAFDYEELTTLNEIDANRMEVLYSMLYLQKYSRLNPAFTADFFKMTHAIGLIKYLVLRGADGQIQSFSGMHQMSSNSTMPMTGYDLTVDQKVGLYRLACHAGHLYAARHNLKLNMSSGVGSFKLTRGATPEIEYTAFYFRHLPLTRRIPLIMLRQIAENIGVPIMKKYKV